jgi:hypothetical protein
MASTERREYMGELEQIVRDVVTEQHPVSAKDIVARLPQYPRQDVLTATIYNIDPEFDGGLGLDGQFKVIPREVPTDEK